MTNTMSDVIKKYDGKPNISNDTLIEFYNKMVFSRKFEEACVKLYLSRYIAGFCHLYIGQEAVIAGVYAAIKSTDQVITSYRDHCHILFAGTDPKKVMAELIGRYDGVCKGKGGSMHLFDTQRGFYGGHGIVGAQVSLGTGIAFANKYNQNDSLCVTFFGDGASHQGQVYESFNMAKLWNLPVIYIIENNEYAMGTCVARSSSSLELYKRGIGFNIPGVQVDGMDFFAMKHAMDQAVNYVRSGNGPIILEVKTYRYRGHSMSDPAKYRTKEEVENYKENKDPIANLEKYMIEKKIIQKNQIEDLYAKTETKIEQIVEFAKNSPPPPIEELYTDVLR
jgi:pyruvate dehydrogenase E1 component alpha subunit